MGLEVETGSWHWWGKVIWRLVVVDPVLVLWDDSERSVVPEMAEGLGQRA